MKKIAILAMVVAFVIFWGEAAKADDALVWVATRGYVSAGYDAAGRLVVYNARTGRMRVVYWPPMTAAEPAVPVTPASVAKPAPPVNYQVPNTAAQVPQPVDKADIRPAPIQAVAPPVLPPVQIVRPPVESSVVQPKLETKVASVPPVKPAVPATPALAKPAAPVNREQQAKTEPTPKPEPNKGVRKLYAMKLPVENRVINGKFYKEAWGVVEEVNGVADQENIKIMDAPPAGAEIVPFKG